MTTSLFLLPGRHFLYAPVVLLVSTGNRFLYYPVDIYKKRFSRRIKAMAGEEKNGSGNEKKIEVLMAQTTLINNV